jgi:hypothetical protein
MGAGENDFTEVGRVVIDTGGYRRAKRVFAEGENNEGVVIHGDNLDKTAP